jgi:anti-sigma factor RsiW
MNAQDIHALSGAYAVDALDDIERIRFEEHLAACADCRDEVASLRDTTWMLGGLTDTAPPPEMRDRLLAGIKEIRPLPPETMPKHRADEAPEPSVASSDRRRFGWRTFAAAAAVLAVVGTGTVAAVELIREDSSQTMSTAERVLNAKDATTVAVDLPGAARARVVRSVSENRAVLVTSGMPAAPNGKVYELWLQHDDVMVPAGLMPAGRDQTFVLKGDAADASAAGITVEPEGGSDEPTSAPIALFDFSQAT